ncbi:hypothetical protein T492DRAFT_832441 [Pavlovales sp. CCMP2436]|nr:hypothetical protein T492DRAFT_832441 [Pavlovales sp. CCMP2436]
MCVLDRDERDDSAAAAAAIVLSKCEIKSIIETFNRRKFSFRAKIDADAAAAALPQCEVNSITETFNRCNSSSLRCAELDVASFVLHSGVVPILLPFPVEQFDLGKNVNGMQHVSSGGTEYVLITCSRLGGEHKAEQWLDEQQFLFNHPGLRSWMCAPLAFSKNNDLEPARALCAAGASDLVIVSSDFLRVGIGFSKWAILRRKLGDVTLDAYFCEHIFPHAIPASKNHYAHSASHGVMYITGMMHADRFAVEYGARALVVCPKTTSNIPGHVPLDSYAVASHFMSDAAVAQVQVRCEKKKAMRSISRSELASHPTAHADAIWEGFLRTEKKVFSPSRTTGAQPRKRFDYFCQTDGVSISLKMTERTFGGVTVALAVGSDNHVSLSCLPLESRTKKGWKPPCASVKVARGAKAGGEPYITDQEFIDGTPSDTRVVTVDPNARDLMYALEESLDPKKPTTLRYTSMQRRFESGEKAARIERERLGAKHSFSESNIGMATVSHRTTDTELLSSYIQVASLARSNTRAAYALETWREMRLRAYSCTQRSEAKLVAAFEFKFGPPETTTVAWGNWSKPPGMRGLGPVPGKRLRDVLRKRGYRLALLDEFGTSTTCIECKAPCNCAAFNRDVHACLNMQLIARAALDGQERPKHLDRKERIGAAPSKRASRKRKASA